jgi:hypothetical protein
MNFYKHLLFVISLFIWTIGIAQKDTVVVPQKYYPVRQLTIEPGIGFHTNMGTDLLITNLIQWNLTKHLSLASHTSYNINNVFQRDVNTIKTNYNCSINQKFGIGATFYAKHSANTFLLMVGAKYTAFRETLNNPNFDKTTVSIHSLSPDYGMMYTLKKGVKKYFFSFRVYIPLYPWPVKESNILAVDGNLNNISLEFGVGIKIK